MRDVEFNMSDTQAVLAANQAFYQAFQQKNVEAMSAIWSRGTGSLCVHPGRPVLQGWDQIRQSWDQIFQNTEAIEIQLHIVTTNVQGAIAYVVLVEQLSQVVRGRRIDAQSMATNIFERMGNTWYLVHHHGSPIMPPPRPPGS